MRDGAAIPDDVLRDDAKTQTVAELLHAAAQLAGERMPKESDSDGIAVTLSKEQAEELCRWLNQKLYGIEINIIGK